MRFETSRECRAKRANRHPRPGEGRGVGAINFAFASFHHLRVALMNMHLSLIPAGSAHIPPHAYVAQQRGDAARAIGHRQLMHPRFHQSP